MHSKSITEVKHMTKKEINGYIRDIQYGVGDARAHIPEEILKSDLFIEAERKAGLRRFDRRGYDVINDIFFVIDFLTDCEREEKTSFNTFDEYYAYLKGEIYEKSSYYQYSFSQEEIDTYNLDLNRLSNTHFIDYTIDDFSIDDCINEQKSTNDTEYNDIEYAKKNILKWIDKLCACSTLEEYTKTANNFKRSRFNYYSSIVEHIVIQKKPKLIFQYLTQEYNKNCNLWDIEPLFGHYSKDEIANAIEFDYHKYYDSFLFSEASYSKRKREFNNAMSMLNCIEMIQNLGLEECEDIINDVFNLKIDSINEYKGFSTKTHFYYICTKYTFLLKKGSQDIKLYKWFVTFEDFATFLNNDLSDCDFSEAKLPDIDFSKFSTNDNTLLPKHEVSIDINKLNYSIEKKYRYGKFSVVQTWKGNDFEYKIDKTFDYFGDFVYYLKNDLSNADLLMCSDLINLNDISELNLENVEILSVVNNKFSIPYKKIEPLSIQNDSFAPTLFNEENTALVLQRKNEFGISEEEIFRDYITIKYISDIHLDFIFANRGCKSIGDEHFVIKEIAKQIAFECGYNTDFLLIGGDTTADPDVYKYFIDSLNAEDVFCKVIFLLGNHELWGKSLAEYGLRYKHQGIPLHEIIEKYHSITEDNTYFSLLQNDMLVENSDEKRFLLDEETLLSISQEKLTETLKDARLIILGGIGFSGLNEEFNANNGIYRDVINREDEIEQSQKFEAIYNKLCIAAKNRNVIIFTHMPIESWTHQSPQKNFIYVNGHSHRNYFFDDGETRIYADNQSGYHAKNVHLKHLYVNKEFDCFSEFQDGIYEITNKQYLDFYRAKNIRMDYNRDGKIYMIKRYDYYCFIWQGKTKNLSLLNGGALKKLNYTDINYYYEHMPDVINTIKEPLDKYTAVQAKIAEQVKHIGGYGTIHGAIIDIDFYNHIYVNPHDLSITGYFAYDIVRKYVYQNIPSLLKDKCPELYSNYIKLLKDKKENSLVVKDNTEISTETNFYYDTDIYKASRIIKKMQKVNHGILSAWSDDMNTDNLIEMN
jgi:hypothetical protein